MLFNSLEFLILLAITFAAFYAVPNSPFRRCWQTVILLIASTIFYGWEDYRLLLLLAISCGGNAVAAIKILLHRMQGEEKIAKRWVTVAVILNLLLLGVFKYAVLLSELILGSPPPCVLCSLC